jgi:hypothetical protein
MQVSILLGYLQEVSQTGGSFKIRGIAHTMQVSILLGYLQELARQVAASRYVALPTRGIAHTMQVSIPLGYLQEISQLQKGNFSTMFTTLSAGRMVIP